MAARARGGRATSGGVPPSPPLVAMVVCLNQLHDRALCDMQYQLRDTAIDAARSLTVKARVERDEYVVRTEVEATILQLHAVRRQAHQQ